MENLKQMTDRDQIESYLDGFSKAKMVEMITEMNKNLGKYPIRFSKSTTKIQLKTILVEHFAFIALNKMIANRPHKNFLY